jgi:uncharacterized protein YejL (UPF0352 family)
MSLDKETETENFILDLPSQGYFSDEQLSSIMEEILLIQERVKQGDAITEIELEMDGYITSKNIVGCIANAAKRAGVWAFEKN